MIRPPLPLFDPPAPEQLALPIPAHAHPRAVTRPSSATAPRDPTGLFPLLAQGVAECGPLARTTAADRDAMARRSAAWMRRRHPQGTPKRVALDLEAVGAPVQPRTVEGWLGGSDGEGAPLPGAHHLMACGVAWGPRYWLEVAAPGSPWAQALATAEGIDRMVREVAPRLDALRRAMERA